jgi:ATP-binding cassette subfamily C (CFTR/MRP) protein 4
MMSCIKDTLQAKGKGVILVTHQLQYLRYADKVLVLDNSGNQTFYGTYTELQSRNDIKDTLDMRDKDAESHSMEEIEEEIHLSSKHEALLDMKITDEDALTNASKNDPALQESEEDIKRRKIIEIEEKQTGRMSWEVYRRYTEAGGTTRGMGVFVIILGSQALLMITDYWLRWWASSSFGSQDNIINIYVFAILVFLCIVVGFYRALVWFGLESSSALPLGSIALTNAIFHC